MASKQKYYRFYINSVEEQGKLLITFLDDLSGHDRNKLIRECLYSHLEMNGEKDEMNNVTRKMKMIEERLNNLENNIVKDTKNQESEIDWHQIWNTRHKISDIKEE